VKFKINQNGKSNYDGHVSTVISMNCNWNQQLNADSGNHGKQKHAQCLESQCGSWGGRKSGNSNHSHSNMDTASHSDNTVSLHPRRVLVWGKRRMFK
jgi:hypothetical protein